jgi:hypothetical protein
MYAVVFSIFNIIFSIIYYFNKDKFSNMKSFLDALYYTLNVSTTVGYGDIVPQNDSMKITTIIQTLFVFLSISKFFFQSQPNFMIFAVANILLIVGMIFAYKHVDPNLGKSYVDYAYFSTITHTTVGFGDHKKPLQDKTKWLIVAHILIMFLLLNSYNNGLFSMLRGIAFGSSESY